MRTKIAGWLGRQSGLSIDLLYPCMFSDSVWTVLLTLQHIRALQLLHKVQHLHMVQCLHTVQHLHMVQHLHTVQHQSLQRPPQYPPPLNCNHWCKIQVVMTASTLMPSTSAQPFDFSSFGPELDFMLQTGSMVTFPQQCTVSTTPQWNFGGLGSDTIFSGDMTTANTATDFSSLVPPSDYLAMLAHTGLGLPTFSPTVSPAVFPSKSSLPLLPPLPLIDYDSLGDDFTLASSIIHIHQARQYA